MFATLWKWWTIKQSRTWLAHSLVALIVSWIPPAICVGLIRINVLPVFDIHIVHLLSATAIFLFFLVREAADEIKHKEEGEWRQPGPGEDGVSFRADRTGDLIGPLSVFLTSFSIYFLI